MKIRIMLLSVLVGAYLVGFGVLAGVAVDRMLFDKQRSKALGHYEDALRDWHAYRIMLEKTATEQRAHPEK